ATCSSERAAQDTLQRFAAQIA
ncbi:pseudouridine synthase domain protein, partial [Vibrio parahaemolyticus V-223/04]